MAKKDKNAKSKETESDLMRRHDDQVQLAGLVLSLLFLTSWREEDGDYSALRSWRSYDWDALDMLYDAGLIEGSRKNKSVWLTKDGEDLAHDLVSTLKLDTGWLEKLFPFVPPVPAGGLKAYRLNVNFDFSSLSCWRAITVPVDYTFFDLHLVLQTIFNWLDYHVYDFTFDIDGRRFFLGETRCFDPGFFDEACSSQGYELVNIEEVTLADVFERTDEVHYNYDWGDDWNLTISCVGTEETYRSNNPTCTDGAGDNPPDDVGGEGGFEDFLRVIADKDDPEHQDLKSWGTDQGFEHFDVTTVNKRMPTWRRNKAIHMRNCENEKQPLDGIAFADILATEPKPVVSEVPDDEEDIATGILDFDYEKFKRECAQREKENAAYLEEFEGWLNASGLKPATVSKHILNVSFYLNTYLLHEEPLSMRDGCFGLDGYLGDFFIRKCAWSTPASIKTTAASLKKFYRCMREGGHIDADDYEEVKWTIKEFMPDWQDQCESYNNGDWLGSMW